jgi:hypothetical protein
MKPDSRRRVVTVFAALAVAAGCGIPVDNGPRQLAIPETDDPAATTTTTIAPDPEDATFRQLWFIRDGLLRATSRQIADPISHQSVFEALISGPTDDERAGGIETRLPDDFEVRVVLFEDTLTIDILSEGGLPFEGEFLIAATAQLVFTGVFGTSASKVLFKEAGEYVQQLNGAGELQELDADGVPVPLQIGDFDELRDPG